MSIKCILCEYNALNRHTLAEMLRLYSNRHGSYAGIACTIRMLFADKGEKLDKGKTT